MDINDPKLNQYCEKHSSAPSKVAQELSDYTYQNVPIPEMVSGPVVGAFLGFMVKQTGAKNILEVGCYTGYSALCMAEHLPEDGKLITLDINPETAAVAREYWDKSPHGKKIEHKLGPALESIVSLSGPFDLVFIDADKKGYPAYVRAVLPLLSENGLIVCDNALQDGAVLEENPSGESAQAIKKFNKMIVEDADLQCMLAPIRDGLLLIRRR